MPRDSSRTAVYLAEALDAFGNTYAKVGIAKNVLSRLPSLQVGCPFDFASVRYVYVPTRDLASVAERKCHIVLGKYHLRGEWFFAAAGDDAALTAFGCFSEVVAAVVEAPVKVGRLNNQQYERARALMGAHFGQSRRLWADKKAAV